MVRGTTAVLIALLCPSASAMTRIASDGRATISELEVLIEPDAWVVRARLDGNATRLALLFPMERDATASIVEPELLDRIDHQTSPRFQVIGAHDPCSAEKEAVVEETWPARTSETPRGFEVRTIAPLSRTDFDALLQGVSLDEQSKEALARLVREGRRLVLLSGAAPGKMRGFWTPPLRITTRSRSIPIGLSAPHITIGRVLHVHLFTRGTLAPKRKLADLPSEIFLPEITLEDPLDLFRATAVQTIRREGDGTAIRIFSGELARWFLQSGREDARAVIDLEERPLTPFRTNWKIRRVWRKPIACDAKERYLNNVRIQQKTEIQTYAAITGRHQAGIEALMRKQGYLLENGKLSPIRK